MTWEAILAFVKGIDPRWLAYAATFLCGGCVGCVGGCSCERNRPHVIVKAPEPVVMTIDGKDYTYDRTPEGGWKRRD